MINLENEIANALKEFTTEVEEGLEKSKEKRAKEGAKTLKSSSPKKTGKYARGWRARRVGKSWVVHNSTSYQLTHLLEKGHAKVGGGRVAPRVHIAPVEEMMIREYEKDVEKVIKG